MNFYLNLFFAEFHTDFRDGGDFDNKINKITR